MAAAGAHRYWSIYVVSGYNSSWLDIYEVELRVGGVKKTVSSASAPSSYTGRPISNIIDGNTSTLWTNTGSGSAGTRIVFDMGSPLSGGVPVAVDEVAIYSGSSAPKGINIEYSDNGSTFTSVASTTLSNSQSWQSISVEQAPPDPSTPQKTVPSLSVDTSYGWSNPNNVLVSDNVRASKVVTTTSSNIINLKWTNTLPENAILLGCVLKVECYVSSTASGAYLLGLYFTAPTSGNGSLTPTTQYLTTTETTYTFGSASTLPTGFDGASRPTSVTVRIYQNTSATTTHYIDYIGVELWWKLPGGKLNVLFIGELF